MEQREFMTQDVDKKGNIDKSILNKIKRLIRTQCSWKWRNCTEYTTVSVCTRKYRRGDPTGNRRSRGKNCTFKYRKDEMAAKVFQ